MPKFLDCLPALTFVKNTTSATRTRDYLKALEKLDPTDPSVRQALTAFRRYRQDQRRWAVSKFLQEPEKAQPSDPPKDLAVLHKVMVETKKTFFDRLRPRLAPTDLVRIRGAYYLAKFGHRSQVRKSEKGLDGKPLRYFEHVRRVAIIAMDECDCYDPDLICTALLHDTLEDTDAIDAAVIEQFFGKKVAQRVRLLTKDPKAGYLERLLSADSKTRFIKLCDRLDNLRSLPQSVQFRDKTLKETYLFLNAFSHYPPEDPYYKKAERGIFKKLSEFASKGIFLEAHQNCRSTTRVRHL